MSNFWLWPNNVLKFKALVISFEFSPKIHIFSNMFVVNFTQQKKISFSYHILETILLKNKSTWLLISN